MDGYEVTLSFSPEDDYYVARIAEFTGCATDGPTAEEALTNLREVKAAWIESMQRMGHPIPPPRYGHSQADLPGRRADHVAVAA